MEILKARLDDAVNIDYLQSFKVPPLAWYTGPRLVVARCPDLFDRAFLQYEVFFSTMRYILYTAKLRLIASDPDLAAYDETAKKDMAGGDSPIYLKDADSSTGSKRHLRSRGTDRAPLWLLRKFNGRDGIYFFKNRRDPTYWRSPAMNSVMMRNVLNAAEFSLSAMHGMMHKCTMESELDRRIEMGMASEFQLHLVDCALRWLLPEVKEWLLGELEKLLSGTETAGAFAASYCVGTSSTYTPTSFHTRFEFLGFVSFLRSESIEARIWRHLHDGE